MPSAPAPRRLVITLVVVTGVLASATAPILIKLTPVPPLQLAAGRLLLAALLLAPLAISAARRTESCGLRQWLSAAWLPGLLLGLHFTFWNAGVRAIHSADAALIGNLTPLVFPFLLAALASERISRRELAATAIAFAGMALRWRVCDPGAGELLCLLAMVLYAAYLAFARRNRALPSIWPYIALVYAIGGVSCALLAPAFETLARPTIQAWLGVAALAAIPTILGHTAINWALRYLRGQVVTLCFLMAPPLTGVYAWLLWHETTGPGWTYAFVGVALGLAVLSLPLPAWMDAARRGEPAAPS